MYHAFGPLAANFMQVVATTSKAMVIARIRGAGAFPRTEPSRTAPPRKERCTDVRRLCSFDADPASRLAERTSNRCGRRLACGRGQLGHRPAVHAAASVASAAMSSSALLAMRSVVCFFCERRRKSSSKHKRQIGILSQDPPLGRYQGGRWWWQVLGPHARFS